MKIKKLLIVIALLFIAKSAFSGTFEPYNVNAKDGVFIILGNEIPKNFEYRLYKQTDGGDFIFLKSLTLKNNFDLFYNDLKLSIATNPIFEDIPNEKKAFIWDYIQKTSNSDSIPLYGGMPYFKVALGLAYFDSDIKTGTSYAYKIVKIAKEAQETEKYIPAFKYEPQKANITLKNFKVSSNESAISLRYLFKEHEKLYTIKLYRGISMQASFMPISSQIILSQHKDSLIAAVMDTNLIPKIRYQYFAVPYDIYGNAGDNSDTVEVLNQIDKIGTYFVSVNADGDSSKQAMKLTWKAAPRPFQRSVDIYRSDNYNGEYKLIANATPTDTCYYDLNIVPVKTYYYYLILNMADAKSYPSARFEGMLKGSLPAMPPRELRAVSSKDGAIRLSWKKPSPDSKGYYIFRSSLSSSDEFKQISGLILSDSSIVEFTDSLKNNADIHIRYAVKTLNTSSNISDFSDTIEVNPKLKAKLSTPMNLRSQAVDNEVLLTWIDDKDFDLNIIGYKLYRKTLKSNGSDSTDYEQINTGVLNESNNYFHDATVKQGVKYQYSVRSFSTDSVFSAFSAPSTITITQKKPLSIIEISSHRSNNSITLNWSPTLQRDVASYKIYRMYLGKEKTLLTALSVDKSEYTDNSADQDQTAFYAVSCVNRDGIESDIEEWTRVENN